MEKTADLQKKIESAEGLQSVVKTMKALAAVNIRQYEEAVKSVNRYYQTVEMGFQIVMRDAYNNSVTGQHNAGTRTGIILFGSDQGMCGQFNETLFSYTDGYIHEHGIHPGDCRVLVLGSRITGTVRQSSYPVSETLMYPKSLKNVTPVLSHVLRIVERWGTEQGISRVLLFYSKLHGTASSKPFYRRLLPVPFEELRTYGREKWENNCIPTFTMERDALLSALVRQYLYVSLYTGFAESLASENASRLASMQVAEKNIEERLSELRQAFNHNRQSSITSELLDIVSGFEALKNEST